MSQAASTASGGSLNLEAEQSLARVPGGGAPRPASEPSRHTSTRPPALRSALAGRAGSTATLAPQALPRLDGRALPGARTAGPRHRTLETPSTTATTGEGCRSTQSCKETRAAPCLNCLKEL